MNYGKIVLVVTLGVLFTGCGVSWNEPFVPSCTVVTQEDGSSKISCPDGSESVVQSGQQGPQGAQGEVGPVGSSAPTPSPSPVASPDPISELVELENEWRVAQGQSPLAPGLTCRLYTVPANSSQIVGTTLTQKASFTLTSVIDQPDAPASDGLNILPSALKAQYQTWFVVRCTGFVVVAVSDYVKFDLRSDDGSNLYIDGSLLINNDGNHGPVTKSGTKLLRSGVHSIQLDYMQGPGGSQSLQLHSGGVPVPSEVFFR